MLTKSTAFNLALGCVCIFGCGTSDADQARLDRINQQAGKANEYGDRVSSFDYSAQQAKDAVEKDDPAQFQEALDTIARAGNPAMEQCVRILQGERVINIFESIETAGPETIEADKMLATRILGHFGRDAAEAIPALEATRDDVKSSPRLRESATKAIEAIKSARSQSIDNAAESSEPAAGASPHYNSSSPNHPLHDEILRRPVAWKQVQIGDGLTVRMPGEPKITREATRRRVKADYFQVEHDDY